MSCQKCKGFLTSTREEEYCVNCGKRTRFFTKVDYDITPRHEYQEKIPRNMCACGNTKRINVEYCQECWKIEYSINGIFTKIFP